MADGVESLRQRIRSTIRFRLGEWFFAVDEGLDYSLIFGHSSGAGRVTQVIVDAINEEGEGEITAIREVRGEINAQRQFIFHCVVDTIYGESVVIDEEVR